MTDKHCDVPCEAVDKKLELKVTWRVFTWVLSGIGSVGFVLVLIMMGIISNNQKAIANNQKLLSESMAAIQVIQVEMKYLNGNRREDNG